MFEQCPRYGTGGDAKQLAEQFYDAAAAHVAFLGRQVGYGGIDGVPSFGLLGDWCSIEPLCPGSSDGCLSNPGWNQGDGDVTASFYYVKDLEVMLALAVATNRTADVQMCVGRGGGKWWWVVVEVVVVIGRTRGLCEWQLYT
jgi:hypothetical protein